MLVIIDNYDSFVYNLVRYVKELHYDVMVFRNDEITIQELEKLQPSGILISPGPCTPNEAGISLEAIRHFHKKIPLLGVCLGHQSLIQFFGGNIVKGIRPMHGKVTTIEHNGNGIFKNLKNPLQVTRYHSLVGEYSSFPTCLEITSLTPEREIMGIQHKYLPIYGVQFHPEAELTEDGHLLLQNFIDIIKVGSFA